MKSIYIPRLFDIIQWKKGGGDLQISTHDDCLTYWPEDKLGPTPDDATLLQWKAEWDALPDDDPIKDPKAAMLKELRAASTIAQLRTVVEKFMR